MSLCGEQQAIHSEGIVTFFQYFPLLSRVCWIKWFTGPSTIKDLNRSDSRFSTGKLLFQHKPDFFTGQVQASKTGDRENNKRSARLGVDSAAFELSKRRTIEFSHQRNFS
jgi:hypothetical protein